MQALVQDRASIPHAQMRDAKLMLASMGAWASAVVAYEEPGPVPERRLAAVIAVQNEGGSSGSCCARRTDRIEDDAERAVRMALRKSLTGGALPARVVFVPELPLLPSGIYLTMLLDSNNRAVHPCCAAVLLEHLPTSGQSSEDSYGQFLSTNR